MITAQIKAHSRQAIYLTLPFHDTEGFVLPIIGSEFEILSGELIIKIVVEKIEPRDGCINIYSAQNHRAQVIDAQYRCPVLDCWKLTEYGEILVLPHNTQNSSKVLIPAQKFLWGIK